MYPLHIREEQLKNEVAKDFFSDKSLDSMICRINV